MISMSIMSHVYRTGRKQRRPYQPGRSWTSEIGTLPSSAGAVPGGPRKLTREGMTCGLARGRLMLWKPINWPKTTSAAVALNLRSWAHGSSCEQVKHFLRYYGGSEQRRRPITAVSGVKTGRRGTASLTSSATNCLSHIRRPGSGATGSADRLKFSEQNELMTRAEQAQKS